LLAALTVLYLLPSAFDYPDRIIATPPCQELLHLVLSRECLKNIIDTICYPYFSFRKDAICEFENPFSLNTKKEDSKALLLILSALLSFGAVLFIMKQFPR
jgi:hypothetical protein